MSRLLSRRTFGRGLADFNVPYRETASVEGAARRTSESFDKVLFEGDNVKIGLEAFARKKKPEWVASKI